MRKNSYLLLSSLFLLLVLSVASCKQKPKQDVGPQPTTFEKKLTNQDSLDVMNLVDQFFEAAKHEQYQSAAAMLVRTDNDKPQGEPHALNNDEMKRIVGLLSSMTPRSYQIDYLKFSESYLNEVKVTALIEPAKDGRPEVKTVFYFRPIFYMGKWRLSVVDSNSNSPTIVDGDKQDSVAGAYAKQMREKNVNKK